MRLEGLFAPDVATCTWDLSVPSPPLHEAERLSLGFVADRRLREFQAGRACARQALKSVGLAHSDIPMGSDRAPVWPAGYVGSISHSGTRCAAAVAGKSRNLSAIGLDIEATDAVQLDLTDEICTRDERLWLEKRTAGDRGQLLTTIFSAKECLYKCQYGLTGMFLEFRDVRVDLDLSSETFFATIERHASPIGNLRLSGRYRITEGHVVTAMTLPSVDIIRAGTAAPELRAKTA